MCGGRKGAGQSEAKAGCETSTTGAQRRDVVGDPHDELAAVVEAWVRLPGVVRRAILGAVRAFASRLASPVAEACPQPSPRASTGPATPSAPSSTGCSRSTSSATSGSTRNATRRGRDRCARSSRRDRRGLPHLRPARGRLRADPLPGLPGRAPSLSIRSNLLPSAPSPRGNRAPHPRGGSLIGAKYVPVAPSSATV